MKEKQERFGFRKLTIGLASVCIGATLFGVDLNTVKADTIDSSSQAANANEVKTTDNVDANDVTTISNSANQIQSDKQNEATTLDSSNKTDVSVNDAHKAMPDASSKTGDASKSSEANATNTLTSNANNTHVATTAVNTAPVKYDNKSTVTVNTNSLAKPAAATSNITNKTLTASKVATKNSIFESNEDGNTIATSNSRLLANLNKILIAKQPALISTKIANANLKLIDSTLPVLNTNDAYALDEKNGLHEHANVNDNGGYDKDFWGTIDLNNWNYAQDNTGNITLEGYKGSDNTKIIVPNIADFAHGNAIKTVTLQVNPNVDTDKVYISSSVMHDLAHNATRLGLSKTENKKVVASDAIWQDAFGGLTNEPGTYSNGNGGIKYGSPNLTQMDLHNLGTASITDMSALFNGGSNLTTVGDLSEWNTSKVTDMMIMFQKASSLTNIGNLDNWDISNVTDMNSMFSNATNLTNIGNLDNWNTSNVTNMRWMFGTDSDKQSHLTNIGDLSKWQTANVTDMRSMFSSATNLTNIGDLSKWNTSKVTNMAWMFSGATNLTNIGNLDNWNTSNVTDMSFMFNKASNLTNIGDLSTWDISKVTNMKAMFNKASNLTNIGDLSTWDISKVTNMSFMFNKASNLTNIGDLSKWNTSNVTDMSFMFNKASNLTNIGDLSTWDISKVTNMKAMFQFASSLTNIDDLSKWDTSNVTDMSWMFIGTKSLHNLNISNWNLAKLTDKEALKYIFANDVNSTVIANNITLPAWYDNELTNSDYFWNNHMAVITNNDKLLKATGDTDTLTTDNTHSARSIFYDSKGSSDAIKVLTDVNDQYIADYNKANPSKLLKLANTVDQSDPISLANASFITVPKVFNITVHFEDVDPHADQDNDTVKQELAKTVELSGNKGNAVDLGKVELPTNFELSGDLPSATFGDADSVTIKLKHKIDKNHITNKHNNTVTLGTDVQAPDGTLLLKGQSTIESIIDQYRDLVTGDNVDGPTHWSFTAQDYTHGSDDIINKYIENYELSNINVDSTDSWNDAVSKALDRGHNNGFLTIKLKDGYTASMNDIGSDWTYSSNTNTYTWLPNYYNAYQTGGSYVLFKIVPLDQSVHYQFMDNGTQVGSDVIVTGKTGETVAPNLKVPDNYEVADGTTLPTSYTFDATNPTVQINLKHKTETSVESLPATRTINVHLPNGTTKVYQQVIGYQRDVITDLVTKEVTHGTWTVNDVTSSFTIDGVKQLEHSYVLQNGTYNYASVKLPKIPGYKAKISCIPSGNSAQPAMFLISFVALPSVNPGVQNALDDTKQDQSAKIDTKQDQSAKIDTKQDQGAVINTKQDQDVVIDTKQDQDAVIDTKHVNTANMQIVSNQPVLLENADNSLQMLNADDNSQTLNADTSTWQVENNVTDELITPYVVFNLNYKLHLPRFDNYNLQIIKRTSNKDNLSFVYLNQNKTFKYVFNIKIEDGKYLLSISEIENKRFIPVKQISFNDYQQLIKLIVKLIK